MLNGAVADGDGDGAKDVARMFRPHVIRMAEIWAAKVADVETLQGDIEEPVASVVRSKVRAIQKLQHERPTGEGEIVAAGDRERHLRGVVTDVPASRHGHQNVANSICQFGSLVALAVLQREVRINPIHKDSIYISSFKTTFS